eukprot:gene17412-35878_t
MVMPISVDEGEPRNAMRLRDVLRQPFDDMEDNSKPYRLSVEERQRLREQLRGQSPQETNPFPFRTLLLSSLIAIGTLAQAQGIQPVPANVVNLSASGFLE